ncbi:MAG: DUF1549 and DUF1553 domain-containing protein [Planctomycetota bacterium]|nr:DUF1549 and DUF1553 domain-containing protein [Planctomycetota bacterium]
MTRIGCLSTKFIVQASLAFALFVATSILAMADGPVAPLETRFQPNASGGVETTEVPDFQRHISPLLGRLGCNGRACHGSFQGQGGFTLSLFGYDFDADMKALLEKDASRVNVKEPLVSKILLKPVDAEMHEGGQRFAKNGWEYWVLRKWIEAGAPIRKEAQKTDVQKLVRLEVSTLEIQFAGRDETKAIHAIAVWEDGSQEDVTSLCRFSSNDTSIAKIDEKGIVTSGDAGDTHVVVSYDNAVVPVSVLRPVGKSGHLQHEIASAKTEVDRLVLKKLDKMGINPSGDATDAEFFRRVSLDLAGTLPTSSQVRAFLDDSASDKRAKMIERILDSPGYAAWWTTFLCDMTGNNDDQLKNFLPIPQFASQHWYQWIYARVAKNVPYDQIVEGIVTAVSREPNETYLEYCETMTKILDDKSGKSFADRSDLMYYWARLNQRTAEEKAISFAYTFCGVRIQCAQCHKHPFDQWSKQDFDQFERLFDGIVANQNQNMNNFLPESKKEAESMMSELGISKTLKNKPLQDKIMEAIKQGKTVPFPELFAKAPKPPGNADPKKKGKNQAASQKKLPTARLLGAQYVDLSIVSDPREPLMEWLRRKDNPYFAKAIVNRIWAHYFQAGIVNPPDDLNLANAPSNAELLDYLSNGFIENHYDLKWLHRTILNSATYQRTWQTNETNSLDRRNFSHALLRRLPAETAYDALRIALSNTEQAKALCNVESDRAMTLAGASAQNKNGKNGLSSYALTVFGRSIRESNCDCDKSSDPSLLQTVFIRNDADVLKAMNDENSWLVQVAKEYNLPVPRKNAPNPAAPKMEEKQDVRTEEVLDRDVRKFRRQLESLSAKEGSEKAVKRIKSELALAEKRLKELTASQQTTKSESTVPAAVYAPGPLARGEHDLSHEDEVEILEEVYLRTLSRKPTQSELERSQNAIAIAENPTNGISDVLWALINSKEFILNH